MRARTKTALKPKQVIVSITICVAVCLAGIGYIWAKAQVYGLGREIKGLETRLDDLKRTNALLSQSYATMCSPRELDLAVRRLNLGLTMPRPDQIVRMQEPLVEQEKSYAAK
jgi:hypothetical protein